MKHLVASDNADLPALHRWREHALQRMLFLILLVPLPILALDALRMLPGGELWPLFAGVATYALAAFLLLNPQISYQWRSLYLIGSNLLFASYLMLSSGLISAGRVYLLADIVAAALMLSRRATLLVWLSAAVALGLSSLSFAGRAPAEVAELAQRLTDPNTLLANTLITLMMGAIVAVGAFSLLGRLAQSLRETEQALAERDLANTALEQRVSERTRELEQALGALQGSEAKYKTLFQAMPVGVLFINEFGDYVEVNQLARDLLGFDRALRPVRKAAELTHQLIRPDGRPLPLSEYPSVRATRERRPIADLEFGIIDTDDPRRIFWVTASVAPLEVAPYGAVITLSDITAFKHVEAELRNRELRLRSRERFIQRITDTIPELIYVYDVLANDVVFVNPAVEQLLGHTPATIRALGSDVLTQLVHPDDLALVQQQLARLSAATDDEVLLETEFRMCHADGSWRWMAARNNVFLRNEHGVHQILGVHQDITAHKLAEQALERQIAVQAAVVQCSRTLLSPTLDPADQTGQLSGALAALLPTISANHVLLMRNLNDPDQGLVTSMVTGVSSAEGNLALLQEQIVPWAELPAEFRRTLEHGDHWAGPIRSLFAGADGVLLAMAETLEIRAILCEPIFVEQAWWGMLIFTDSQSDRVWTAEAQLMRMATEIIGTAILRWQTEAELSLQLRYAEALAHCSQILLRQPEDDDERREALRQALALLQATSGASCVQIYQHPDYPHRNLQPGPLAVAVAPGITPYLLPPPDDAFVVPDPITATLKRGEASHGLPGDLFPPNSLYRQELEAAGAQSLLMLPIFLGDRPWGMVFVVDHTLPRVWDGPTVQLLRTATEMIATFQQGWEAAEALLDREHLIQRVMGTTPDYINVFNLDTGKSVFANRALGPLVGYAADEVDLSDPLTIARLVPDDQARLIEHYERLRTAEDGQVLELEYRARLGDGRERWVLSRNVVFARDAAGQPSQILTIAHDVTDSKLTARALASNQARLQAWRDALPDLLFVVDARGVFLEYLAPRDSDLFLPPSAFLGRSLAEVMPPEICEQALIAINRVLATGKLELFEYSLPMGEQEHSYEARIVRMTEESLLVVVRNITERRRATRELLRAKEAAEAADRAKSTFLAHISHEIRTPLTAIIGMSSLLRDASLGAREREYATTIHTGARTLLTIIGNILDFSKIEADQMELSAQPFDLRACLQEAIDLVAHEAAYKGLRLTFSLDETVPASLTGDAARLRQVLVNLLGNAVKFTERGEVTLRGSGRPLGEGSFELTLTISDTGIGIAPDHLAHIFDPFVQANSATTLRYGGTGLGLAISKQLVELMHGQIAVASAAGAGSTFTLTLPLLRVGRTTMDLERKLSEASAAEPGQLRVLLAEDNLVNQEVVGRLLESLGCTPDVVANGLEALEAVTSKPYDVVLMDIQMPELDGEAATRRIRALEGIAQPYIIALTASALRGDRERYLAAGMDDYLSKPVQTDDLRAALARPARQALSARPARQAEPAPAPAQGEPAPQVSALLDLPMLEQLLISIGGTPAQTSAMILELFRSTLANQLAEIAAAIEANDRSRSRLLAHKLRGGSRQLGATHLADCWAVLEQAAQAEGEPLAPILDQARASYDQTLAALIGYLPSITP